MTIDSLAERLAKSFADGGWIGEADIDLYTVGLDVILSTAVTAGVVLLLSLCLGNLGGGVLFLLCFAHIRSYSGGYHAATRTRCLVCTVGCYAFSYVLSRGLMEMADHHRAGWMLAGGFAALAVFYNIAPLENKNKRLPEDWKHRNRKKTFGALLFWSAAAGVLLVICKGCAVQIFATIVIVAALLMAAKFVEN